MPHELFRDKNEMKEGENMAQAPVRQLEKLILRKSADMVAAFVFEPIQGDSGAVNMHRDSFPLAD
ncbi:hypothetical protein PTT_13292 [Pyrenophora teres f. teres 0-1]|uniref:Uncharacterized protein n=1 Tax=Pyrenophora teres f. teres (strain 0-1) TaxID=861557 RepID=E3RVR2_PYRTT|nr:hypothetical protein PTT_13292 [Pyrenophora teres f. teres 0-1]